MPASPVGNLAPAVPWPSPSVRQSPAWPSWGQAKAATTGDTTVVEVTARDAAGRAVLNLDASAALAHPTDRRADVAVALAGYGAGQFRGSAPAAAGQWDLVIELSRDGNRLFRSKNRVSLR